MLERPNVLSQKAIYFFNWTNEPFSYKWNNEPYEFAPKQRMLFPEGIAWHFAKHLAEHFFNKDNVTYNLAELEQTIERGLIREGGVDGVSEEKMRILAMNSNNESAQQAVVAKPKKESVKKTEEVKSEVKPAKKRGRPAKKVEVKAEPQPEVKDDLAEFAGK